ncbi:MAG: alpha/beta hydrolase [Candidatus Eremiobacteraeota bacterium]|nr:alpha/beta hydrolase [Candidatus Eremiobacteraeota bacterium]
MLPLLAMAALFGASGDPSPCPASAYRVDVSTHAYGADSEFEALDLYLPHGAARAPVAVYVHGGAWVSGDKSQYVALGDAFARCGIAAAIVNYPLAPDTPAAQQAHELGAAVRWLQGNAAQSGFDVARLYLVGHSAGAQLAWFAIVSGIVPRTRVAGVVAIGAVGIDPSRDVNALDPRYRGIYDPAFGPDRSQWQSFDIAPRLRGVEPPSLVIHGRDDDMAPEAISAELYEQLKTTGNQVEYLQPSARGHWDLIERLTEPGDATMTAIERFILSAR